MWIYFILAFVSFTIFYKTLNCFLHRQPRMKITYCVFIHLRACFHGIIAIAIEKVGCGSLRRCNEMRLSERTHNNTTYNSRNHTGRDQQPYSFSRRAVESAKCCQKWIYPHTHPHPTPSIMLITVITVIIYF